MDALSADERKAFSKYMPYDDTLEIIDAADEYLDPNKVVPKPVPKIQVVQRLGALILSAGLGLGGYYIVQAMMENIGDKTPGYHRKVEEYKNSPDKNEMLGKVAKKAVGDIFGECLLILFGFLMMSSGSLLFVDYFLGIRYNTYSFSKSENKHEGTYGGGAPPMLIMGSGMFLAGLLFWVNSVEIYDLHKKTTGEDPDYGGFWIMVPLAYIAASGTMISGIVMFGLGVYSILEFMRDMKVAGEGNPIQGLFRTMGYEKYHEYIADTSAFMSEYEDMRRNKIAYVRRKINEVK